MTPLPNKEKRSSPVPALKSSNHDLQRSRFFGRERERAKLLIGIEDALAGGGSLFFISGEPGIGKTRLADQISREASARGLFVAWGRCWEGEGAPAYWPWIQIVRELVTKLRETIQASESVADAIDSVSQIVPEVRGSHSAIPASSVTRMGPDEAQFRMFDALARLLRELARPHPLLLVLDDLHDADSSSLMMLKFAARELKRDPITIVGTYRDQEVKRSPELARMLGSILREGTSLPLTGFSKDDVEKLADDSIGRQLNEAAIAELHRVTSGNPLFIEGVLSVLAARADASPAGAVDLTTINLPDGVREVIRSRIAMLPEEAAAVLPTAAALGNEFAPRMLELVSDRSPNHVLEAIAQACDLGLLARTSDGEERYRFSHALIRNALYETTPLSARPALHRKIGEALELKYDADLDPPVAELAHHFREAARGGDPAKAIDYLIRAGKRAEAVYALQEALAHWQTALELLGERGDSRRRANLLDRLGHYMLLTGSDLSTGQQYLDQAVRLYDQLNDDVRAAAARADLALQQVKDDDENLTNTHSAIEYLKGVEPVLRNGRHGFALAHMYMAKTWAAWQRLDPAAGMEPGARASEVGGEGVNEEAVVSGMLGRAVLLLYGGHLAEAFEMEATAAPRVALFPSPLARLRHAQHGGNLRLLLWEPGAAAQRWEEALRDPQLRFVPLHRRMILVHMGVAKAMLADMAEARRLSAEVPRTTLLGVVAYHDGDWARAAELFSGGIESARRAGSRVREADCSYWLARALRATGDSRRSRELLAEALVWFGQGSLLTVEMWLRPEAALVHSALGELDCAEAEIGRCRQIVDAGEDWRGLRGNLLRAEAVFASSRGDPVRSSSLFAAAIEAFRQYQLPWEEADVLELWGLALKSDGDRVAAGEKFGPALEIYRRIGANQQWLDRAMAHRDVVVGGDRELSQPRVITSEPAIFRREADYWSLSYRGKVIRLKDAKGLNYIAHLLRNSGQQFLALDLAAAIEARGRNPVTTRATVGLEQSEVVTSLGDSGPLLDARAKAQYRSRRADLRQELEDAERDNDVGRAQRVREEIELLSEQLSAAVGLGGRDRRVASHSERARWMVTKRIRADLRRIRDNDPTLGRLLESTIRTGTICAYIPDSDHPIVWTL